MLCTFCSYSELIKELQARCWTLVINSGCKELEMGLLECLKIEGLSLFKN